MANVRALACIESLLSHCAPGFDWISQDGHLDRIQLIIREVVRLLFSSSCFLFLPVKPTRGIEMEQRCADQRERLPLESVGVKEVVTAVALLVNQSPANTRGRHL